MRPHPVASTSYILILLKTLSYKFSFASPRETGKDLFLGQMWQLSDEKRSHWLLLQHSSVFIYYTYIPIQLDYRQCVKCLYTGPCVFASLLLKWCHWHENVKYLCAWVKFYSAAGLPVSHPLMSMTFLFPVSYLFLLMYNEEVRPQLSGWSHLLDWVLVSLILD